MVAKTYEMRARHANREGVVSDWSPTIEHTVGGDLTPPGAVTDFEVFSAPNGIRATWTNPTDDDFAVACVYVGTTDVFADAELAATLAADVYESSGWTAGTEYRVWVLAKDLSGNEGAATGPELVTPTAFAEEGAEILTGDDAPDDTNDGKDGDLYVRADGALWIKANGTWTNTGIDLTGDPGAKIHTYDDTDSSGDPIAPPSTIDANVGDIAIHTESGQYYQYTATGWKEEGDLTGPQGNTGPQGLAGDPGEKGDVGPKGGAERHRASHETEIGVRFAGPNQLVHLIGNGEAPPRLGRDVADRLHRAAHTGEGITDRNQTVSFTHVFSFSHAPQTQAGTWCKGSVSALGEFISVFMSCKFSA